MPSLSAPPTLPLRALRREREDDGAEMGRARAADDFATASKAEVPNGDNKLAAAPAKPPSSSSSAWLLPPSSEVADEREGGGIEARSGVPITET